VDADAAIQLVVRERGRGLHLTIQPSSRLLRLAWTIAYHYESAMMWR
jgi:hypothetical protein